jgi:hypothetical protein
MDDLEMGYLDTLATARDLAPGRQGGWAKLSA